MELKPCPFCGSKPEIRHKKGLNPQDVMYTQIRCSNPWCIARTQKWRVNPEEAELMWNIRMS